MVHKNSKKWIVLVVGIGLITISQGSALAADSSNWLQSLFGGQDPNNNQNPPDQKQVAADQAAAAQFQQTTLQDQQALGQAYQQLRQDQRTGVDTSADRQTIQNLRTALNTAVGHQQANAQDLAKDGVANPYTIPTNPGYPGARTYQPNGSWNQRDRQWDNRPHHNEEFGHRRHEATNWGNN